MSSPTIKDKPVQIRPWRLSDADFVLDASLPLDPRKTVFVGGVPRPLKAGKILTITMGVLKGGGGYHGIVFVWTKNNWLRFPPKPKKPS